MGNNVDDIARKWADKFPPAQPVEPIEPAEPEEPEPGHGNVIPSVGHQADPERLAKLAQPERSKSQWLAELLNNNQ
ncbi:hypothetical protein ACWDTP_05045 [Mycobacterium sp. NPDC003449]